MATSADETISARLARAAQIVRRLIGAPDYDRYIAHISAHHPEQVPLTKDAFARDALARRYNQPGNRCC